MILYQTLVLIVLLALREPILKWLKSTGPLKPRSPAMFFCRLNRWDQTCRFFQYALAFVAGYLQSSAIFILDHAKLTMIGRAHQLNVCSSILSSTRKLIRLARLKSVLSDFASSCRLLNTPTPMKRSIYFQAVNSLLSDFFNLLYYFTDHYTLLFSYGLLSDHSSEYIADYWGNIFWILSNVFLAVKDLILIHRLRMEKGKDARREADFAKLDFIRNIVDTVIAMCFFRQGLISQKVYGIMGVGSSLILLADFWK